MARAKLPPNAPCPKGHTEGRDKTSHCIACRREHLRSWRAANPEKDRAYGRAWDEANREKRRASTRKWQMKNPEKLRAADRAWKRANREVMRERAQNRKLAHGLSARERDAMLSSQGGRCAICRSSEPGGRGWHGDHDHTTGRFRAVLCQSCNIAIGQLKDNPARCRAVADYLERHAQLHALL